jgi:hypothetical protein
MCTQQLCLAPTLSKWLWRSSWLHASSMLVAVFVGMYDLALFSTLVLITSLNYWRDPDYGWRRYLDIVCVQISCWWLAFRNLDALEPNRTAGFILGAITFLLFVLAVQLHAKRVEWSTALHVFVHFFGNAAAIVINYGHLPIII